MEHNKRKDKKNLFVHSRTFNILLVQYIYLWYSKEKINKYFLTVKTTCILFHESAVCRRGIKWKNTYLISMVDIVIWLYCSLTGPETRSLLFRNKKCKGMRFCFWNSLVTSYRALTNFLREITTYCIHK